MPTKITEARAVVLEGTGLDRTIRIITPGMGSSGYYPTATLESAVSEGVFGAGLHLYVDHPSVSEDKDRPERSVRDLGAVSTGPAVWNEADQAIDAPIKIFPHYSWLGDVAEAIGMSIRASADVSEGTIDGQQVRVIDKLVEAYSVDFVTKAGRGGKILQAMESARVDNFVAEERLQSDLREQLDRAVGARYNTDQQGAWVRDLDESAKFAIVTVYPHEGPSRLLRIGYAESDLGVSLAEDAIEVRSVTTYVPVTNEITAEAAKGAPIVEITEADHQALTEKASRVDALESENRELKAVESARVLRESAEKRIADKIGTTLDHLPQVKERAAREALRGDLPVTDSGELDGAAFDKVIDSAVEAEKSYAASFVGAGISGHGASKPVGSDNQTAHKRAEEARARVPFNRPTVLKG